MKTVVVVNRCWMDACAELVACALSHCLMGHYRIHWIDGAKISVPLEDVHAVVYLAPHPMPNALLLEMCLAKQRVPNGVEVYCVSSGFILQVRASLLQATIQCYELPDEAQAWALAARELAWVIGRYVILPDASPGEIATMH